MIIYIARHGDAEAFTDSVKDSERVLTRRGRAEVNGVAKSMLEAGENAELIIASPYQRAQQTAQLFAESWGVETAIQTELSIIPSGNIELAEQVLRSLDVQSVLIASHMPMVAYLTARLAPASPVAGFGTANVAKIRLTPDSGELLQFYQP